MAETTPLAPFEAAILNEIQTDFPISADPYGEIAARVGGSREDVHAAVLALRERGIIRRVGGSFVAKGLGYVSVLVASLVQPEQLEAVAQVVGAFPEVTHSYQRTGAYNFWFTVIAEDAARLEAILAQIRQCDGVQAVHALPAQRTFKIRVDFRFAKEAAHAG